MKGKRYILALLICMFSLASCASPLKKSLVNEEIPQFNGSVTPITIPIQLEYKPVKSKINISMAFDYNLILNTGSGKKSHLLSESETSMKLISDIKKLGDMLIWNMKVIEYTENNNAHKPHIPIAEFTLLTDKYGDIKESEISLPFFEQPQVRSKIGEKEFENMKKEIKESLQLSSTLPNTPVITGDYFIKTRAFESLLTDSFFNLSGKEIPEEPASIVKGWAYYDDRKVLVSSIDHTSSTDAFFNKYIVDDRMKLQMQVKGYNLSDAETLMLCRGEIFVKTGFAGIQGEAMKELWRDFKIKGEIPTDPSTSADFFLRARITVSSKLEN